MDRAERQRGFTRATNTGKRHQLAVRDRHVNVAQIVQVRIMDAHAGRDLHGFLLVRGVGL